MSLLGPASKGDLVGWKAGKGEGANKGLEAPNFTVVVVAGGGGGVGAGVNEKGDVEVGRKAAPGGANEDDWKDEGAPGTEG